MTDMRSAFVATKTTAIRGKEFSVSERFRNVFGMSEGDYFELDDGDGVWKPCRILFVETCYTNSTGGDTAMVKCARILRSGDLSTKTITLIQDSLTRRLHAIPIRWSVRKCKKP